VNTPLRLLIIEDSEDDALLIVRDLKRAGYEPIYERAETEAMVREALDRGPWDVVVSDFSMPHFTGTHALKLLRERDPDTPFIFVSGTIGEDVAVEAMRAGAQDYVTKGNLRRLVPAIERELRDVAVRRERHAGAARFRRVVESAMMGILFWDAQGKITDANDQFLKIVGYTREDLQAGRMNWRAMTPPEYEAVDANALKELAATGTCTPFEKEYIRKDGSRVPIIVGGARLDDPTNPVVAFVLDITERKRAEDALRHSEERYRLLFDSGPHPMWVYDLDTLGFITVNEAAIRHYGYTRDEFLAMTIEDIRPPEDIPKLREHLSHLEAEGSHPRAVWRHRTKDGRVLNVEVNRYTLQFEGKRAALALAQDVTERLRLEQRLLQAQKMEAVGRLAGGVAHDFNNVLTAIFGYVEMVIADLPAHSPSRADLEEVRKAATRAASLTRQLLAFSRQQVLQPTVLNVNDVVQDIEKMLQRLIGDDVEVRVMLAPDVGNIRADTGQLEQIILNLAVNARDAMPTGGKLTIETAGADLTEEYADAHVPVIPGAYVMLAVSDTGSGMTAEVKARMFEPFFTTKGRGRGTGLGLATVYGIVKQSGGYIWVYSEPGLGTAFKVYLPRVDAPVEPATQAPELKGTLAGTETVLLAEDDELLRPLARSLLLKLGYTVLDAPNAAEALVAAGEHQGTIHLLITDVVMPGQSGRDLARALAQSHPDTKVLYMSGYTDDAIVHHGMLDPGLNFLQKPFTPATLARKVREVLDAK
jgi:two-component system cell cycle sensor histidine kinase/response regulator CckA